MKRTLPLTFLMSHVKHSKLQLELIKHSLPYVHKYGWTDHAIIAACENLDLSRASHRIINPYDLIAHSMQQWNRQSLQTIDDTNFGNEKRIRDKIFFAIKTRLALEIPYLDTWHQAMKIGAYPDNALTTKDLLWEFSDEVWHRCGDKSTDYNYYTKRILFNSAYAATELHLLTDQSPDKFSSWEFLDRRLDDILTVGKGINNLKTVGGAALEGLLSLTTVFSTPPKRPEAMPEHPPEKEKEQQP